MEERREAARVLGRDFAGMSDKVQAWDDHLILTPCLHAADETLIRVVVERLLVGGESAEELNIIIETVLQSHDMMTGGIRHW
ncbi:MAG: hypothetical protein MUO76_05935 [Anaerolineaceae bacterium]|nr:hypothetical protein [Anaerolineaceae bacterium]